MARPFFAGDVTYDEAAIAKHLSDPGLREHLDAWRDVASRVEPFDASTLERALRDVAAYRGIKAGALIHATRVAVTGQASSPSLFDVLALVGREQTIARLAWAINRT